MYFWYIGLSHFVLAVILFYLVNWLGNKSGPLGYMQMSLEVVDETAPAFNYIFKVLSPVVYIILLSALFQTIRLDIFITNIYFVVVFYWVFRFCYVVLLGHFRLINWPELIIYWMSSIGISIWVYSYIENIPSLLPSPEALLDEFWLLIILFLYSIFNKLQFNRSGSIARKEKYIEERFLSFSNKYDDIVNCIFSDVFGKLLTYSIMIYENFNRSKGARAIERLVFRHSKKYHTYGVMQVMSNVPLSDSESVSLGAQKVRRDIKSKLSTTSYEDFYDCMRALAYDVSSLYNKGDINYPCQVCDIMDFLKSHFYSYLDNHSIQELKSIYLSGIEIANNSAHVES